MERSDSRRIGSPDDAKPSDASAERATRGCRDGVGTRESPETGASREQEARPNGFAAQVLQLPRHGRASAGRRPPTRRPQ